jgi:cytochrome o ubiquinol oxidase subunit 2
MGALIGYCPDYTLGNQKRAPTLKALLRSFFLIISTCLLSGCDYFTMLHPKGYIAASEINIMWISVILMLLVVVPVIVMTLLFSWQYRESNTKAKYEPEWSHSVLLEIVWWSVPCIIIAALATITWISCHTLDPFKPIDKKISSVKPIKIDVIAMNWKWLFIYPEQNIATVNYVSIPVNTPIQFNITAVGPMNSFLIPQLAGQIYAMAGMQSKLHLIAGTEGVYDGFSANFSGAGFSGMRFKVHVNSSNEFTQWVADVKKSPLTLSQSEYKKLLQPSSDNPTTYYSGADKYIFISTMMKAMMPEKDVETLCRQQPLI